MTFLRALSRSLPLPQRPALTAGRGPLSGAGNLLNTSVQSGMQAYKDIGAVYGPTRRICESVALTNWSLYQQVENAGNVDRQLIDDATAPARHPGTAIWTQPNPFMSRRVFLYLQQLWQETAGGVYWLICQPSKSPPPFPQHGLVADFELWPIRADRITPIPDPDKYLAGYVYTIGMEKIPLEVSALIPLGWPDPLDPLRFSGPLQAIRTDLDAERYASEYNRNVFLNDARPGGVVTFPTKLTKQDWDEFAMKWREQHQGVNNARRIAVIEAGTWVDAHQSNQDMDYTNLRSLSREAVMFASGMPFSVMQTHDVNLANANIGLKTYYSETIRPRLETIKEPVNQRVLPYIADNLTMDYELPAPEDPAFDVFASATGFRNGIISQNEARDAMRYDATDGGDRFIWEIASPTLPLPNPRVPQRPTTLGAMPVETIDDMTQRYAEYVAKAGLSDEGIGMAEARCPDCHRLLGRHVNAGATLFCGRCRAEKVVLNGVHG